MSSRVDDFTCWVGTVVFFGLVLFSYVFLTAIAFYYGVDKGHKDGYIQALDDIRLGNTPKYKLVQIAEKWVEVER